MDKESGGNMKKRMLLPFAFFLPLLAACVPYYVDRPTYYEPTPPSYVEVPALPPQVVLEERPYYRYRDYHYYWDVDVGIWLYSRSNRGPWYQLPRSHYPGRFQYRGRWYDRDYHRGR
jgi:hypothetical protein